MKNSLLANSGRFTAMCALSPLNKPIKKKHPSVMHPSVDAQKTQSNNCKKQIASHKHEGFAGNNPVKTSHWYQPHRLLFTPFTPYKSSINLLLLLHNKGIQLTGWTFVLYLLQSELQTDQFRPLLLHFWQSSCSRSVYCSIKPYLSPWQPKMLPKKSTRTEI